MMRTEKGVGRYPGYSRTKKSKERALTFMERGWEDLWLFFKRSQIQVLAPIWQLTTVYNSSSRGPDTSIAKHIK